MDYKGRGPPGEPLASLLNRPFKRNFGRLAVMLSSENDGLNVGAGT